MGARELKVGLMLVLIFAAGVFCGVVLDRKFLTRAPDPARGRAPHPLLAGRDAMVLAEMTEKMNLTPEQQKRVGEILGAWSARVKQSRQQALKERLELFDGTMPGIRTNLTPEQIPAYDEMVERARRRQRRLENRMN
jgi:hypothetical protein